VTVAEIHVHLLLDDVVMEPLVMDEAQRQEAEGGLADRMKVDQHVVCAAAAADADDVAADVAGAYAGVVVADVA